MRKKKITACSIILRVQVSVPFLWILSCAIFHNNSSNSNTHKIRNNGRFSLMVQAQENKSASNSNKKNKFTDRVAQSAADVILEKIILMEQEEGHHDPPPSSDISDEEGYYLEDEDDEFLNTLLDNFGHKAKIFLTQRFIPNTDAECDWSWKTGRCEPYCHCDLQYQFGDYHLGRSCRIRPNADTEVDVTTSCSQNGLNWNNETIYSNAIKKITILQKEIKGQLNTLVYDRLSGHWKDFHDDFCEIDTLEEPPSLFFDEDEDDTKQSEPNLLLFPPEKFPNIIYENVHRRHQSQMPSSSGPFNKNYWKKKFRKVICHPNKETKDLNQDKYFESGRQQLVKSFKETRSSSTNEMVL